MFHLCSEYVFILTYICPFIFNANKVVPSVLFSKQINCFRLSFLSKFSNLPVTLFFPEWNLNHRKYIRCLFFLSVTTQMRLHDRFGGVQSPGKVFILPEDKRDVLVCAYTSLFY